MTDLPRIRTVSALLVDLQGKLVIQLRDDKPNLPYANHWSTLGGAVETGETPDQAMERELIEEIEFCPPVRFWKIFELSHVPGVIVEVHAYIGELGCDISAVNLHEGQRLGSFSVDEIDDLPVAYGLEKLFKAFFAAKNA
jgi:8-oxo-dGTP diphosphatase